VTRGYRPKIKICGLTDLWDARAAAEYGADFLGFVFAPSARRIDPIRACEFWKDLPEGPSRVGVFKDQKVEEVDLVLKILNLDYLQFHGDESPIFCRAFAKPVIKACTLREEGDLQTLEAYREAADFFQVDLPKTPADSGALPLELARAAIGLGKPVLLAGGLTPENVRNYVAELRPFGLDVARGVEYAPGKKDWAKIREFVERARE
jgi:phosphoribosylanthranilate isomerase